MENFTLEEIGRLSGVSRSTVSRVINDQPNVSPRVRERVLQVINETGFQPNIAARSLALRRTNIIGLVIPATVQTVFTDPYFPRLIQGITHACNQRDLVLSLFILSSQEEEERHFPRISNRSLFDGLIVQSPQLNDPLIGKLIDRGIPFVMAGRLEGFPALSYVDVNNEAGVSEAMRYLVGQGHRRIGVVAGPQNTTAGRDRLNGYHRGLGEAGLQTNAEWIVEGDFTEHSGYQAGLALFERGVDAIVACSDPMAAGVIRAANERGLSIPDDVALMGFDDLPTSKALNPPLTTVRQPIYRLGEKLVEVLAGLYEEDAPTEPLQIVMDTELVIRRSA